MATSLTKTSQECTDPPDPIDTLQKYEDDLENKTPKDLKDTCKALNTKIVCLEGIIQELQADELAKKNEKLVAEVEELKRKLEEREHSYFGERIGRLEEEAKKIKKLEEEIKSIRDDRTKDNNEIKQEVEDCKKQVQNAQETMFQPILGIVQRQQDRELLRREISEVRKRAEEHPYEVIQPGPPPQNTATTHQKEPSHPKFSNTVHGQHVTIYQQHLPAEHSLAKENLSKPPPNDNFPAAQPPPDDLNIKSPVQSTDDSPLKETAPESSNVVMV